MRSRFAESDTDEEILPQGMARIGYDADTETYTFSGADGSIWEGSPGSRFGTLTRVGLPVRQPAEAQGGRAKGLPPSTSGQAGDSEKASSIPNVEENLGGRRRSASRALLRCVSKVTSSLRPRSSSQASSTSQSPPDTLSPDVEDFLSSHVRREQDR